MDEHDLYDQFFEPCTAISAEGARTGITSCKLCGVAVMLDPRDTINRARQHVETTHEAAYAALQESE